MISAWHLLWIIPVSASVGMILTALLAGRRDDDPDEGIVADPIYDPIYHDDDRKHCGLLEDDDP